MEDIKVNPLIATVIWGRFDLFKIFVKHYQQFGFDILVIGSEGKSSRDLCENLGCIYIEHPNTPLTKKFNKRVEYFMKHKEYTHLFMVGSDDFLDKKGMELLLRHSKTYDIVQWNDIYYYNMVTNETIYSYGYKGTRRNGEPLAPGRCISRKVIEKLNGSLWGVNTNSSPDSKLWANLKKNNNSITLSCRDNSVILVDVKTPKNKNSFDKIITYGIKAGVDGETNMDIVDMLNEAKLKLDPLSNLIDRNKVRSKILKKIDNTNYNQPKNIKEKRKIEKESKLIEQRKKTLAKNKSRKPKHTKVKSNNIDLKKKFTSEVQQLKKKKTLTNGRQRPIR